MTIDSATYVVMVTLPALSFGIGAWVHHRMIVPAIEALTDQNLRLRGDLEKASRIILAIKEPAAHARVFPRTVEGLAAKAKEVLVPGDPREFNPEALRDVDPAPPGPDDEKVTEESIHAKFKAVEAN